MKLRKRITAMLICILMVTGMIMGSTQTTLALKFVDGGNWPDVTPEVEITPSVLGMGVNIHFQKYLYAKNGDASILNNITELNVTIKALYYTPADGSAVQPYDVNPDDRYEVADWPMIASSFMEGEGNLVSNDVGSEYYGTLPLEWGDDGKTYKRIPEDSGVAMITGLSSHSSYTTLRYWDSNTSTWAPPTPQDYALIPPGVYTFEVWEDIDDSGNSPDNTAYKDLVSYDPDHYFIDIYVSNIVDAQTKEPVVLYETWRQDPDYLDGFDATETTITNVTVWKGQNLGQLSGNNTAASGNAPDVTVGDTVDGKEYSADSGSSNYTAPGGTWNAEWDGTTYAENIENLKNTNALGKVSSTATVTDTDNRHFDVTIPFTNAADGKDLVVSKEVTGNYVNLDEVFTYPVTVTDPVWDATATFSVKYYDTATGNEVVDAAGNTAYTNLMKELYGDDQADWVTTVTNSTAADDGTPVVTNTANIRLKDGYTFKVRSLSDRATYTISEDGIERYTPSYTMTAGHTDADDAASIVKKGEGDNATYTVSSPSFAAGASVPAITGTTVSKGIYSTNAAPTTYIYGAKPDNIEGTQLVTAGTPEDVIITFTNHKDYVAPTGFVMSILPYVGAFVAVLAALVVFIVWKKKRTDQTTGTGL